MGSNQDRLRTTNEVFLNERAKTGNQKQKGRERCSVNIAGVATGSMGREVPCLNWVLESVEQLLLISLQSLELP